MRVSFKKFKAWRSDFLARRPHRSFRLTRRRDYVRELSLPGYIAFTHTVNKTLWQNKKIFFGLAVIYIILFAVLVGLGSQDTYNTLADTLKQASNNLGTGDLSQVGQVSTLFLAISTIGISGQLTEAQQIYSVLLGFLIWLTTVWVLRNRMAGHKIKLRDGLYNAGAPIIPTFLVALVLVLQLIPILIAFIGYGAANASGLLAGGVEAMLFWFAACALGLLSLFWATSTFFAMIIVTLPGMYPGKALRNAGDLVLGRRIKILLRWLWMLLMMVLLWAVVLIPFIALDLWLKTIWPAFVGFPLIPIILAMLGTLSIIWISSYVYLLYRKVVDEYKQ